MPPVLDLAVLLLIAVIAIVAAVAVAASHRSLANAMAENGQLHGQIEVLRNSLKLSSELVHDLRLENIRMRNEQESSAAVIEAAARITTTTDSGVAAESKS